MPPSRVCACGCERPLEASSGRGRPTLYATVQCRRRVEMRARKARVDRPVKHDDPRAQKATLDARIADPGKLAKTWFIHRYPESYRPSGDGRDPSGFRTILGAKDYPATVETITSSFAVRSIRGAGIEVTELTKWVHSLPRPQQSDFAFRAVEAFSGHGMTRSLMRGPDDRVSHDVLDSRPDPVTLRELRDYYAQGECRLPGCHKEPHGDGLCRHHYDQRRNGTLAA